MIGRFISKHNISRNTELPLPDDFINGQGSCAVSRYCFGLFRMAYNGCGAIAVYNALKLCGETVDFREIASKLEKYLVLFGTFGLSPDGIGKYLSSTGREFRKFTDYNDFAENVKHGRVFIICYWTKEPWRSTSHFIAFERKHDCYVLYNLYNNSTGPVRTKDIFSICTERRYIRGYMLE